MYYEECVRRESIEALHLVEAERSKVTHTLWPPVVLLGLCTRPPVADTGGSIQPLKAATFGYCTSVL